MASRPMTHEERQELIRQPIPRGILTTVQISSGSGWGGADKGIGGGRGWSPVLDKQNRYNGRQRHPEGTS